jgi:acyl dehydratase
MSGELEISQTMDQMLDEARSYLGQELRIEQYNHEVTYDSIRHYAFGIGDDNPLWCDEEYANRGPFGQMVGPPTFLLSIFPPTVVPGFPGLPGFHAGGDYRWNRLPMRGESILARTRLTDIEERQGRKAGRLFIQHSETSYFSGDGEELAVFGARSYRTPPPEIASHPYEAAAEKVYSLEELQNIAAGVFAEEVRGAYPRYWEEVSCGDVLTPVVKGPLDQMSMLCYYAGALPGVGYRSVELAWKNRKLAQENPQLVANNFNLTRDLYNAGQFGLSHHDARAAQAVGMPGRYDNGHMRIGWTAHLITNWMGDLGFLKRLYTEIRRPNMYGNTTWIRGSVVEKYIDDEGDHVIKVEFVGQDQDGNENTNGYAIVRLPVR